MGVMLLSVMANVVSTYAIYRCMDSFLLDKKNFKVEKLGVYVWFLWFTSVGDYIFADVAIKIGIQLFALFVLSTLYDASWYKKVWMIVFVYTLCFVSETVTLMIMSSCMLGGFEPINDGITGLWILWIAIILEKILNKPVEKKEQLPTFPRVLLVTVPILSIVMMVLVAGEDIIKQAKVISLAIGILIFNMILFYIYDVLQQLYGEKIENQMIEQRVDMYENELEIIKESNHSIRLLRHDMKHHLNELQFYIKKQEYEKALLYIENMDQSITNTNEYIASGNKEIDSTLNYLLQKAEKQIPKAEINVAMPENLSIDTFSINVILGNLLENAIEASQKSQEKYLKIDIKVKKGLFLLRIENSFKESPIVDKGEIVSSKGSLINHGIGLKSVKAVVEKQGGEFDISWKGNRFIAKAMLYLNGESIL